MDWRDGWRIVADPSGFARAEVLPGPECPWCGGVGRREVVIDGVARIGKCRCQRVPDRVALYNAAGVPARHAECTFESFQAEVQGDRDPGPAKRRVSIWVANFKPGSGNRGLVIHGRPGRGKTHLLCAAVRELVFRHGIPVRFVEFTHLLSRIREGIDRNDGEATTLTPLVQVPVLAIDELGKGRKTDWEQAILDELITRRYNTGGVLLASTNFPWRAPERRGERTLATGGAEGLGERLGERAMSRLTETCEEIEAGGIHDFRALRAPR